MFPKIPSITLYDPLADLLGAGDGRFTYIFDDAVKLAGHACPTVAGAFLVVKKALELLYLEAETPQRGGIRVRVWGHADEGVNGPITQIFTLLTGAAAENGFQGLGGHHSRKDLLQFQSQENHLGPFTFERMSTGKQVHLAYSTEAFPPSPVIGQNLPKILANQASDAEHAAFRKAWQQRVLDILKDEGASTVKQV